MPNKKKKGRKKSKRPAKKAVVAVVDEDKEMSFDELSMETSRLQLALKAGEISDVDLKKKLEKVKTFQKLVKTSSQKVLGKIESMNFTYSEYRDAVSVGVPQAKKDFDLHEKSKDYDDFGEADFDVFYEECDRIKAMNEERSNCCLAKVPHLSNPFTGPVCGSFEQHKKHLFLGFILYIAAIAFYVSLSLATSACASVYSHLDGCAAFFGFTDASFVLHQMALATAGVLHIFVLVKIILFMCSILKQCLEACCNCCGSAIRNCCSSVGDACKGCGNVICNGVTACCNCCSPKVDVDEDTAI